MQSAADRTGDLPGRCHCRCGDAAQRRRYHTARRRRATVRSVRRSRRECRPGPGPRSGRGRAHRGRGGDSAPSLDQLGVDWRPASSGDRRGAPDRPGRPLRREDALDAVKSALIGAGASPDCDIELPGFTPPLVPFEADPRPVVSDMENTSWPPVASVRCFPSPARRWSPSTCALPAGGRHDRSAGCDHPPARGQRVACRRCAHSPRAYHAGQKRGVRRTDDAIGMQLKRALAAGQPLMVSELMRPSMVQKGAAVTMLLDSPGITLSAQGQALELRRHRRTHPGAQSGVARGARGRDHRARSRARCAELDADDAIHEQRLRSRRRAGERAMTRRLRALAPVIAILLLGGCGSLSRLSEVGRAPARRRPPIRRRSRPGGR